MLNPYVLLAVGVLWAASLGTAYVSGSRNATNACNAAKGKELADSVATYNKNAAIDAKAAQDAAWEQQQTRVEFRDRVRTVEVEIREKPSECRVSERVYGLLNDAIDAANNPKPAKPSGLPATTKTSEQP